MSARTTKKTPRYADVIWLQAKWNSGTVSCVVLTLKDDSIVELRGERMYVWLRGWSQQWRVPQTTPASNSLRTSLGYVSNDTQAHFAWGRRT